MGPPCCFSTQILKYLNIRLKWLASGGQINLQEPRYIGFVCTDDIFLPIVRQNPRVLKRCNNSLE